MKKPVIKTISMPPEVMEAAAGIEEEPQLYYGMTYTYEYVLYPEKRGETLVLYWFSVRQAKEE